MLCRYAMDFHFLVMEKSWKVIVQKQWTPGIKLKVVLVIAVVVMFMVLLVMLLVVLCLL